MPSDERVSLALNAVAPSLANFRAALGGTVERIDRYLAAAAIGLPRDRVASELGVFAEGRIDAERFAELVSGPAALDPNERATVAVACAVLREVTALPDTDFVVDVAPGASVGATIAARLAELGRAFGATLVAELVKTGRYDSDVHDARLRTFAQHRWNRAERAVAPPLVITVDGADLWAGEVMPYLDGAQRIVFVVRGACPPAPLARLIAPGVHVVQTTQPETLAALRSAEGPMVAALMPEGAGAAEFVHTPRAGAPPHERLMVRVAGVEPRHAVGSWSARQQRDDLQLLRELSTVPTPPTPATPALPAAGVAPTATPATPATPAAVTDPVDRLAGWLLAQVSG